MSNELAKYDETFDGQWRIAQLFANSDLVPKHFKKPENAWIALNMAQRMNLDPFMLMQNLYILHEKPGLEAKLAIALINNCGKFSELEYEISGEGDDFGCVAHAVRLSNGNEIRGPRVSIGMAKKQGWYDKKDKNGTVISKWPSMTELMLIYRAATFFARVNCPEVLFGMQTKDEIVEASDDPVRVSESEQNLVGYDPEPVPETPKIKLPKREKKEQAAEIPWPGDNFPVICGMHQCPSGCYDTTSMDHCTKKMLHVDGKNWIARNCPELIRMTPGAVLKEIQQGSAGQSWIDDAKKALGIDVASTDAEKWAIVEHILWPKK